jgi:hypothetical protein
MNSTPLVQASANSCDDSHSKISGPVDGGSPKTRSRIDLIR